MPELPKLKVFNSFRYTEEIYDLAQAKDVLFGPSDILMEVVVDGQLMQSYEELVQLAGQDCYKDKEFLEVMLVPIISGG